MRVRYFGEQWPSREKPAPICESENYRVPVESVVGRNCLMCGVTINARDRGVITACTPSIWGHFKLTVTVVEDDFDGDLTELTGPALDISSSPKVVYTACAYHLKCFLDAVVGGDIDGAPEIKNRMIGATKTPLQILEDVGSDATEEEIIEALEEVDVEPGRGWKK